MGAHLGRRYLGDASVEPDPLHMPSFPPDYGFPERKERGEAQRAGAARGQRGDLRLTEPGGKGVLITDRARSPGPGSQLTAVFRCAREPGTVAHAESRRPGG